MLAPRRLRALFVLATVVATLLGPRPALGQRTDAHTSAPAHQGAVGATPGPAAFVELESSVPVVDVLYRAGQVTGSAGGAYGANVKAPRNAWFLEEQRAGSVDLYDGVIRDDPALITEGLRLFHYGLARQAPNGSFPGSAWPFHGTALFLAEAAPSLIFLQQSKYARQFAPEIRWDTGRMQRAAYYTESVTG
jgi:hypothetical protein